jgi:hypothetical protein
LGDPKKGTEPLGFPLRGQASLDSVLTTTAKISRIVDQPWRGFSGNIAASMEDLRDGPPK